jgi:hypothetical protein
MALVLVCIVIKFHFLDGDRNTSGNNDDANAMEHGMAAIWMGLLLFSIFMDLALAKNHEER